jgi:hypothetical protein
MKKLGLVDIEKEKCFKRMGLLMQVSAYLFLTAFFFSPTGAGLRSCRRIYTP